MEQGAGDGEDRPGLKDGEDVLEVVVIDGGEGAIRERAEEREGGGAGPALERGGGSTEGDGGIGDEQGEGVEVREMTAEDASGVGEVPFAVHSFLLEGPSERVEEILEASREPDGREESEGGEDCGEGSDCGAKPGAGEAGMRDDWDGVSGFGPGGEEGRGGEEDDLGTDGEGACEERAGAECGSEPLGPGEEPGEGGDDAERGVGIALGCHGMVEGASDAEEGEDRERRGSAGFAGLEPDGQEGEDRQGPEREVRRVEGARVVPAGELADQPGPFDFTGELIGAEIGPGEATEVPGAGHGEEMVVIGPEGPGEVVGRPGEEDEEDQGSEEEGEAARGEDASRGVFECGAGEEGEPGEPRVNGGGAEEEAEEKVESGDGQDEEFGLMIPGGEGHPPEDGLQDEVCGEEQQGDGDERGAEEERELSGPHDLGDLQGARGGRTASQCNGGAAVADGIRAGSRADGARKHPAGAWHTAG